MNDSASVENVIRACIHGIDLQGKSGRSSLQPTIVNGLIPAGYFADAEDTKHFLGGGIPVWRSKDDHAIVKTTGRRKIDIVVYNAGGQVVALIETESDLNDLREQSVSSRNGHYDVYSIAKDSDGWHFDSYNSLERMATAAFHYGRLAAPDAFQSPSEVTVFLESIRSDDPSIHNPKSVAMFLVCGRCRPKDKRILERRLKSLGAKLICANDSDKCVDQTSPPIKMRTPPPFPQTSIAVEVKEMQSAKVPQSPLTPKELGDNGEDHTCRLLEARGYTAKKLNVNARTYDILATRGEKSFLISVKVSRNKQHVRLGSRRSVLGLEQGNFVFAYLPINGGDIESLDPSLYRLLILPAEMAKADSLSINDAYWSAKQRDPNSFSVMVKGYGSHHREMWPRWLNYTDAWSLLP